MPETKRPLKVFLCHASADKPAVRDLYKRLTADGVDAWLDVESLLPGQKWKIEIPKAIQNSDIILVCLSKESVNKEGFVQREIREALDVAKEKLDETIFIIPAKLENCDVPSRLDEYHWVNLYEEDGYKKLLSSLQSRAKTVDATLLPSQVSKIDEVKSKAIELENADNLRDALIAYYELKKLDPDYSGIDEKINQLKDKINKETKKEEKVKPKKETQPFNNANKVIGIIAFITLVLASIFGLPALIGEPEPTPTATSTETLKTFTSTSVTKTPTITITPTKIITATPTPLPMAITDKFGVEMALVPAGEFTMGSEEGNEDESPLQVIYLDNFFMDTNEVSNKLYSDCVIAGVCLQPEYIGLNGPFDVGYDKKTYAIANYYDSQRYEDYPVVYVNWSMAKNYCEWRGARLPTEAEWEKASRSEDGRMYPWGNKFSCGQLNVFDFYRFVPANSKGDETGPIFWGPQCDEYSVTAPIGSFGSSPYGIYDLSGNVSEWVSSLYLSYPYSFDLAENLNETALRVYRGDSFFSNPMRSSQRKFAQENYSSTDLGFRCVISP